MHSSKIETFRQISRILLQRFFFIAMPFILLCWAGLELSYRNQYKSVIFDIEKKQESVVRLSALQLRTIIESVNNDLNIIRNSDEFTTFLASPDSLTRNEISQMFARFLRSKPSFSQLRYIETSGREVIRVNRSREGIDIVAPENLQMKSDRYYVKSMQTLKPGDLYISDFDLNREDGEYTIPYEITVRFGIPVFNSTGNAGFLLVNYDGLKLLQILTEFEVSESSRISMGLLSSKRILSFSNQGSREDLTESFFYHQDEQVDELLLRISSPGNDMNRFNLEDIHYYYSGIEFSGAFHTIFDKAAGNWYLISSYDSNRVKAESDQFFIRNKWLITVILLIISLTLFIIIFLYSLKESEHFYLVATGYVSDFSHDGIIITDHKMRLIYCNRVFESTFGVRFDEVKGKKPHEFLQGQSRIKLSETDNGTNIWEGNVWDMTSSGVYLQKFLRIKTVSTTHKGVQYYIGIYSEPRTILGYQNRGGNDIDSSYLSQDTLDFLSPDLDGKYRHEANRLVMILRINNISDIVSLLSESEESSFIETLSENFQSVLSSDGLVIAPRSGMFLLSDVLENPPMVDVLMEKIDLILSSSRFLYNGRVSVEYVSGLAYSPEHGKTAYELINNAYIALDALSRMKRVKYLVYNQSIFEQVKMVRHIKDEIDTAFADGEFSVVYQIQNDVITRTPIGVEALVRWNSSRLGHVSPAVFVPIMEEDLQIKRLGKHILKMVLEECEAIMEMVPEHFKISINLSSQEFNDKQLVRELVHMVQESRVVSEKICFEITETILSENLNHTSFTINYLHSNRISVAIDDFGTGYSSLSYLKHLRSDKLKIDRAFIKDFPENDDGTIIKAISDLAHQMGVRVIVEGVETEAQLNYLRSLHCEEFQGYLESRPVNIRELRKQLEEKL